MIFSVLIIKPELMTTDEGRNIDFCSENMDSDIKNGTFFLIYVANLKQKICLDTLKTWILLLQTLL